MSSEDAERWLAELDSPLPGQAYEGEDEMEQLKHL
jgi:hypothetical protein